MGLALLLAARGRAPRLAGLAAWGLGALLLAAYLAPSGHRAALVGAGVLGAALAAAGAFVLRRRPWWLAFATLLLVPARVPVTIGSTEANLLVPLYLVVGAAAAGLAFALARDRDDVRSRELGPVALPLALFVAWNGISLSWTGDLKQGAVELLFFLLPFGLLALCFARLPWEPRRLPALYVQLAAMGVLFAVVGLYQRATRDIFWNPKVIVGNAYQSFFRVNSLFWDPSIYGRFLVVAILASLAVVLQGKRSRGKWVVAGAVALSWAGLYFSYSQTSFVSLIAGVAVAAVIAFRPGTRVTAVAAVLLVGLVVVARPVAAPASLAGPSVVADATSGRGKLISEGIRIALDHPLGGVGIGDFKHAYGKRLGLPGSDPKLAASHTTPVTVAAETGIVGFLLFIWLGFVALQVPFVRLLRSPSDVGLLVLGLTLLAIAVHSLGYNALFEDPMTWGALGLAVLVARNPRSGEAR